MLYLGIDQHKRQLTVNLRGEDGTVILKRQVSTQWEKVRAFFADLAEKAGPAGGFLAILEVCGMNPWLLNMLKEYGCREVVVIQPTERAKQKTDQRDAGVLSHLLWVHRQQFLDGKHPLGLRRVEPPTPQQADDRQLTALRARLTGDSDSMKERPSWCYTRCSAFFSLTKAQAGGPWDVIPCHRPASQAVDREPSQ